MNLRLIGACMVLAAILGIFGDQLERNLWEQEIAVESAKVRDQVDSCAALDSAALSRYRRHIDSKSEERSEVYYRTKLAHPLREPINENDPNLALFREAYREAFQTWKGKWEQDSLRLKESVAQASIELTKMESRATQIRLLQARERHNRITRKAIVQFVGVMIGGAGVIMIVFGRERNQV